MLRVALDATALLDVRTGVGTLVTELTNRIGVDDDIELLAFGFTRIYLEQLSRALPAHVRCIRRPIPARTTRMLWLRADHPSIERWTGPVDVVHGPNFVVPPAQHAVELVTVHDLTCVRHPELCDANTVQYPALIRRAVNRGAHVHVVSAFVGEEVSAEFHVPNDRLHIVPNGVAEVAGGSAAAGIELARGAHYVLALGTVEPRKNYPLLVEAFDELAATDPDLRLVIAGRSGWGAEALDTAVAGAAHRDRIVRLGYVTDTARADLLAGAAVLAYPSVYEGFGLPPLEGMAAGVPVVATAAGALPEVIGGSGVLVPVEDADALSAGLHRVLTDDAFRLDLIARGRERVRDYSWERTASEMTTLYRQLAAA